MAPHTTKRDRIGTWCTTCHVARALLYNANHTGARCADRCVARRHAAGHHALPFGAPAIRVGAVPGGPHSGMLIPAHVVRPNGHTRIGWRNGVGGGLSRTRTPACESGVAAATRLHGNRPGPVLLRWNVGRSERACTCSASSNAAGAAAGSAHARMRVGGSVHCGLQL